MGGSDSSDLDGECAFDERTASSSSTDLSGSPASSSATSSSPSGSDDERECHVDHVAPFRTISDRMYATAGSLGPGARTYAALESLPWDQRGGRLVHFGIVHSEFRTAARPLRGGITVGATHQTVLERGTAEHSDRPHRGQASAASHLN